LTTINSNRFKFIRVFIEHLSARHRKAGALVDIEESLEGIDRVAQTQNAIAARFFTPCGGACGG
jgi:sRNA-binding protein